MEKIKFTLLFFIINISIVTTGLKNTNVIFVEDFNNLEKWEKLIFPNIKTHTKYFIEKNSYGSFLKIYSKKSASGIILKKTFNPNKYPVLKWRWRVDNVLKKGDITKICCDDAPLRIFVIFIKNNEPLQSNEYIYQNMFKKDLIDASLNYLWGSKKQENDFIKSVYTNKVKFVILEYGDRKLSKWKEEKINIVEDYKKAFGKNPPDTACLGIMSDTDNTHEESTSYIDFIQIER